MPVKAIEAQEFVEDADFVTHSMHVYPAKFPAQLPRRLIKEYAREGDVILDPFCGSGTTLVEARLAGHDAIGVDVNGLAALLSKVKSTPLTRRQFEVVFEFLDGLASDSFNWTFTGRPAIKVKEIEGVEHWFQENVAEELSYISDRIVRTSDSDVRDYLRVLLSSIIVRVSNQDSDTRFAAVEKNIPDGFTLNTFMSKAVEFSKKFAQCSDQLRENATLNVYNADSRNLSFMTAETIDMIITSPPYANTYDYYLYHKFRKRWLDLDVQFAQFNEIGSRREFSSLKRPMVKWIDDLRVCFSQMNRVLRPGGQAFVVIGDSVISKQMVNVDEAISAFAGETGFRISDINSSDLAHKTSGFNPAFAKKGKKEHLIHLEKLP